MGKNDATSVDVTKVLAKGFCGKCNWAGNCDGCVVYAAWIGAEVQGIKNTRYTLRMRIQREKNNAATNTELRLG